jgi:iron complex transport system ATP-binding protein
MIHGRGVTVHRGGRDIVDGVDVDIRPGQVTAVLGANGAGKSTLLRVLAGVDAPTSGTVSVEGADWFGRARRSRARIAALVEQDAAAELPLTVLAAVSLGRIPWTSALRGPGTADEALVADALSVAGVTAFAARTLASLSGGERQRVHLARALAQTPRVLLLDEPTNHLDVRAQLTSLALVSRLARDDGLCVVAALHDLNHAMGFADHVIVLHEGRVVASGAPGEVLTPALISAAWGVTATVFEREGRHPVIAFDLPSSAEDTELAADRLSR